MEDNIKQFYDEIVSEIMSKVERELYRSRYLELTERNIAMLNGQVAKIVKEEMCDKGIISVNNNTIYINNKKPQGDLILSVLCFLPFIYPEMDRKSYDIFAYRRVLARISYHGLPTQSISRGNAILGYDCSVTFGGIVQVREIATNIE